MKFISGLNVKIGVEDEFTPGTCNYCPFAVKIGGKEHEGMWVCPFMTKLIVGMGCPLTIEEREVNHE